MRKALALLVLFAPALHAQTASPDQIRAAATRAVAATTQGTAGFYKLMVCFSCHDQLLPVVAWSVAREHGVPVDETVAHQVTVKGLTTLPDFTSIDLAVQDPLIIDPAASDGWALISAHAAGVKPNLVTAVLARRVARWQRADGHWSTVDARPPQSYSVFTVTAVSAHAMQIYMPEQLRAETDLRLARARAWFLASEPQSTEDATFRLIGLHWTGASSAEVQRAAAGLRALQRSDGGWGELPHLASDAYSTGQALAALNEVGGVPVTDAAWQKGAQFLLSTQAADGSWHVRTRMISPAPVSPPYFETGFPYGHDQFLSTAGTCWAAAALMLALPRAAAPAAAPPVPELAPKGLAPWMQTALLGSADELKAALDGGLDANTRTPEGTTLLMMAADDPAKVKLLIDRGADARAKARSGYTALMVAATYPGTSESVKLLLAHGAEARPGKGVEFDASPLFLAAMAGDQESVALLLKAGADPNRRMNLIGQFPVSPFFEAATYGDRGMVKALLAGGANLRETDRDGMTALHWAVLTHRPDVVKVLIAAGADVNAVDRFGYTPLLYAATVDFGDADTAAALLAAGANPNVKDKSGKSALTQAREYPYLRTALEKAGARE